MEALSREPIIQVSSSRHLKRQSSIEGGICSKALSPKFLVPKIVIPQRAALIVGGSPSFPLAEKENVDSSTQGV